MGFCLALYLLSYVYEAEYVGMATVMVFIFRPCYHEPYELGGTYRWHLPKVDTSWKKETLEMLGG
jgi:hypothetical protein